MHPRYLLSPTLVVGSEHIVKGIGLLQLVEAGVARAIEVDVVLVSRTYDPAWNGKHFKDGWTCGTS